MNPNSLHPVARRGATRRASEAPTKASLINHFSDPVENPGSSARWLLVKANSIDKVDARNPRLSQELGSDQAGAVTAAEDWLKRGVKIPEHGKQINEKGLKVYKASKNESYGSNSVYLAFGLKRPELTVYDSYLNQRQITQHGDKRRRSDDHLNDFMHGPELKESMFECNPDNDGPVETDQSERSKDGFVEIEYEARNAFLS